MELSGKFVCLTKYKMQFTVETRQGSARWLKNLPPVLANLLTLSWILVCMDGRGLGVGKYFVFAFHGAKPKDTLHCMLSVIWQGFIQHLKENVSSFWMVAVNHRTSWIYLTSLHALCFKGLCPGIFAGSGAFVLQVRSLYIRQKTKLSVDWPDHAKSTPW